MSAPQGMRDRLQQQYRLRVLRIHMDHSSSDQPVAVFTLTLSDGSEARLPCASLPELGFDAPAPALADTSLPLPHLYRLPAHVPATLRARLDEDAASGEPLWLRLSMPLGLLAAVPWEELLQARLDVPVLRLPYQALSPRIPAADIDIVVCLSSPQAEPGLRARAADFFHALPPGFTRDKTRFHLFGNHTLYEDLLRLRARHAPGLKIEVHDPRRAAGTHAKAANPWLAWIKAEMGEGSTDVIHFLCHGSAVRDEGMLVLAADPFGASAQSPACRVGRDDLVEFADYLGAWCVAFTSAASEHSAAGMRLLQTAVARYRPGPVLVHDMNAAGSREALRAAYQFLFAWPHQPPASPSIALYCHPVLLSDQDDQVSSEQLARFTLDRRLGGKVNDPSRPWLASSQRRLEMSAGMLADAVARGEVGRARARKLVLDALSSLVRKQKARPTK